MSDQAQDGSFSNEVRRLQPGLVVTFTRPPALKESGKPTTNHARFPHISALGLGEATPDLLEFVCALSSAAPGTLDEVVAATAESTGARRERLRRFAGALTDAGYLTVDAPRSPWNARPVVAAPEDRPVVPGQPLHVPEGTSLLIDDGHVVWLDHAGTVRLRLTAAEMSALLPFGEPHTADEAWAALSDQRPSLSREQFDALVDRAWRGGLLLNAEGLELRRTSFNPTERQARDLVLEGVLEAVAEYEQTVMARPGSRVAVVPVNADHNMAPLSLGLLVAYAQEFDGGRLRDRYDFIPLFLTDEEIVLRWTDRPAIFLFSNYIWNVDRNLKLSALVKEANPRNLTIHGGPSTPKYQGDCEEFFRDNPHVDITVRGEGEATFAAILDALDGAHLDDLSNLHDVAGLSYRAGDGVVHTGDRDRIADLDSIPSPYLLGLFEPFGRAHVAAVVESNRGCPYGCTFCDWGSATLSRIRMFDMERVKAELEWFSKNELLFLSLCDANFGILERDVEIAEHIAALKKQYGYPKTAALNYAKNTMKHLRRIIDVFSGAGLVIEPTVAVQSMDTVTLKTIRRSNIKTEKYDELADEFRKARLPLATDVMMGLPGSTLQSFKNDLQKCTDRDVRARCNPTVLLPNSPMNEPSYREEHGIVARPHEIVRQTRTFTREDFDEMERLRVAFYVFDNFGVLRFVARFVRSEVGVQEVDFYDRVSRDALADAARWPAIASFVRMMEMNMGPPGSWGLFVEEVGRYVVSQFGVEAGPALDTVLEVQLAHLPSPSREMPQTLHLAHDFAAWLDAVAETRSAGHHADWEHLAPRLCTFPAGEMKVADPNDVCTTLVGKPMMTLAWNIVGWDMSSPVARAR